MHRETVPIQSNRTLPPGLIDAFWAYDEALLANDVDRLDNLFADSPFTIRTDGQILLEGFEAIQSYRRNRSTKPTRAVQAIHVTVVDDSSALVVAEVASQTSATGAQTQLWQRTAATWQVTAAHVSAPVRVLDPSVWRAAGMPLVQPSASGLLDGCSVAVKDLFAVQGFSIGGGVPAYESESPIQPSHAPVVAALLGAGASITGIAHTDQFAYSISGVNSAFGTPLNAASPERIPGGSSSGSASAVAQGLATIGLGTDTAGSIRVPAAYQGLWGIRTTHGAISTERVLPLAPTFDTVGWLARDASTLALAGRALLPDIHSPQDTPEMVFLDSLAALDQGYGTPEGDWFRNVLDRVDADQSQLDGDLESWFTAFRTLQGWEAWQAHGAWIESHPGSLGRDVAARFDAAGRVSVADANSARKVVSSARTTIRAFLADRILVVPTVSSLAPLLSASPSEVDVARANTLRLSSIASIGGVPAVARPVRTKDGQTRSVCFIGGPGSDLHLIDTAAGALQV